MPVTWSRSRARAAMLDAGVGHIPEDRQRRGLVLEFSIAENIALHDYSDAAGVALRLALPEAPGRARARADQGVRRPRRRPATRARRRSRAATSRRSSPRGRSRATRRCSIAAQPTRGLDVGAIEYLHRRLVEERDEGRAILLISLELDESALALRPHPRHVRGRDRRRARARRDRGGDRPRDARRPPQGDSRVSEPQAPLDGRSSRLALWQQRGGGIIVPVLTAIAGVPDRRPAGAGDGPQPDHGLLGHHQRRRPELARSTRRTPTSPTPPPTTSAKRCCRRRR